MRSVYKSLYWLWCRLRILIPLAAGIALYFSTLFRDPFSLTLTYSLCIGLLIQFLIMGGRYGLTSILKKDYPNSVDAEQIWPGWKIMGPWILISVCIGYFAGLALGDLLTGLHRTSRIIQNTRALFLVLSVAFLLSISIAYFFYARTRMALMEARTQVVMRSAAENQLKMLESQLEPHMLFNTLANLRVLISLDPPRAQAMLDQIISFLRATLEASRSDTHSLSAEFARINDYLAMMQVRMGSRLQFRLDLPPDLASVSVPPLLLQPLVENAIQHGLEPKLAGGRIEVRAQRKDTMLILGIRDTGAGLSPLPSNSTRFGLQQVRERIQNIYGNDAKLELMAADDSEGGVLITVSLPLASLPLSTTIPKIPTP